MEVAMVPVPSRLELNGSASAAYGERAEEAGGKAQ